VEARWRNVRAAIGDLLTFSGNVGRKVQWSRGLFVSYSGFSEEREPALADFADQDDQGRPVGCLWIRAHAGGRRAGAARHRLHHLQQ
jgi:hypothetical protein